mmetsp:Transcript_24849/g.46355  ORF Transcript_24849/g.46355 Transcript_24849/m.46355 type:complete len:658 (-) Transcript_24849:163-2136(-)|eukprot:CAMPEP_0114426170 /NCGR_PEP_ID=MMETSP0103-20121206/7645_1 /TAXON_ID=37642 ORGANISM="Paraphysomonas imperforata, Strain PA2" /NCGR_SAMPLE_ID=MMETSP0103 /ASSEMBLY_ACC=CAM_ASM_000201 /LENGTH=657 /DNA_ID=CAMNT_0001595093 /DNA_START=41 /DNA_END=2014 /DNA_ORIENTATION=+
MIREPTALTGDVTIIEQKMSSLERENFDLKMRLFYKEKESLKDTSTLENEAEKVVGILQERDDTYDQLRRANEEAYNTISELRSELQLVKASKEGSNSAYESLLHKNQRLASLQLEENLKRERQAAQAIASHDASLIAKLEDDLEALQATHEADNKLVSECAGRVAELMGIIEEKNATIEKQTSQLDAANEHIEVLTDRVSRQEIFLIRGEQNDLLPKPDSGNETPALENGLPSDDPSTSSRGMPLPRRNTSSTSLHSQQTLHSHSHHNNFSNSMASSVNHNFHHNFSMNSPGRRSVSPSRGVGAPSNNGFDDSEAVGSSMSLRPAPRLGQPFMSRGPETQNNQQFTSQNPHNNSFHNSHSNTFNHSHHHRPSEPNYHHFSLQDLSNTGTGMSGSHSPTKPSLSTPHHFPRSPNPSTNFSSPPPFMPAPKSHDVPNTASDSNDLRGLEEHPKPNGYLSDEAKKLINAEIEIDVLKQENASLKLSVEEEKKAFRKLEDTLAKVRSSSEEITLLEAEEIARLEVEMERLTEERNKFMVSSRGFETQNEILRQRLRDANGGSDRSGGMSESPFSSPNGYDSGNAHRESLHNSGELYPSSRSSPRHATHSSNNNNNNKAKDSALFDMYRRREVELLDALEGVVKKCHSLEEELKVKESLKK